MKEDIECSCCAKCSSSTNEGPSPLIQCSSLLQLKKCTSESAYCSCKCLHFTVLIYSIKGLFLSCTWLVVALLGYAGRDHSGQGLHAKVLWNKAWRGSKNSKVATLTWLTWKLSVPLPEMWYTVWVRGKALWASLFIPCLCGFLSNMRWVNSFRKLQNSNNFLLFNYRLVTDIGWGKEADIIWG